MATSIIPTVPLYTTSYPLPLYETPAELLSAAQVHPEPSATVSLSTVAPSTASTAATTAAAASTAQASISASTTPTNPNAALIAEFLSGGGTGTASANDAPNSAATTFTNLASILSLVANHAQTSAGALVDVSA